MSSTDGAKVPTSYSKATIMGVTLSFQVLAFCAVLMRLYARVKLVNSPGWDDAFIVAATLVMLTGSVTICLSADYGLGRHIWDLPEDDLTKYLMYFYIMNASYVLSTGLIKMSILCQYLRVFDLRRIRLACRLILIFTALWCTAFSFVAWVPCFPVSAFWNRRSQATCYGYGSWSSKSFVNTYLVQGAIDVVLDLAVYLIAIPVFLRQKLGKREKCGFHCLFFLGLLVCIFSSVRLATVVEHRSTTDYDWSWSVPITTIVSSLEVNVAVITASIPIFWPMLEAGLGVINVTQEVHVTRQYHRHNDSEVELEGGGGAGGNGSGTELCRKETDNSYREGIISFTPVDGTKIWSDREERPA